MEFAFGFRFSQRKFRMSFLTFTPISITSLPGHSDMQPRDWANRREISNRRQRVLRRDRYRCRGCDKDERDVTVAVHLINPDVTEEEHMLTLCKNCFAIVNRRRIIASRTPEFLLKLWAVLHSRDLSPAGYESDENPEFTTQQLP
ncbi:hypothetical protein [Edaphobacter sp. 12200R-103]|jgi:hypothetical protein|uniref:hypothetical protein n=1 Tax=Edaphobacter sp. 12200R-103 TaxID=2703788 RepID=UPI00138BE292|nr:hypothetical protein [Edaphobacter sp. 12200R-103]QHS50421.1 hypothetical protein GWR55_00635 [Edaphobacter sp. 12200R-103]